MSARQAAAESAINAVPPTAAISATAEARRDGAKVLRVLGAAWRLPAETMTMLTTVFGARGEALRRVLDARLGGSPARSSARGRPPGSHGHAQWHHRPHGRHDARRGAPRRPLRLARPRLPGHGTPRRAPPRCAACSPRFNADQPVIVSWLVDFNAPRPQAPAWSSFTRGPPRAPGRAPHRPPRLPVSGLADGTVFRAGQSLPRPTARALRRARSSSSA